MIEKKIYIYYTLSTNKRALKLLQSRIMKFIFDFVGIIELGGESIVDIFMILMCSVVMFDDLATLNQNCLVLFLVLKIKIKEPLDKKK